MRTLLVVASALSLVACTEPPELSHRDDALAAPPEVAAWLAAHQLPLDGVEAGHGLSDLAALAPHLDGARVIGLGEATHGSREIFQLKHRLIEYLVTARGVRVLGFEAGLAEGQDVDAYLQTGRGEPARIVAGLGYWPWMTDEVTDLVTWLRAWNRVHPHDRVHFVGFDMQVPDRALRDVLAYLARVDPPTAARYRASLAMATSRYDFFTLDPDTLDGLRTEALALVADLDAHAAAYTARSSADAHAWHRRLAEVVVQCLTMTHADLTGGDWDGSNVRDAAMADNVAWLAERAGPDAPIALWAHDDHVARGFLDPAYVTMGQHLAARFGAAYRPIATAFDRGGFQALGAAFTLEAFTVPSGGPETLDGALAAAVAPQAIVPLAELPTDGPVADWFASLPAKREITAGYLEELADAYFYPVPVREHHDALAFVAETTRARPTVYARDQLTPAPTWPTPQNLDLEATDGALPAGWFSPITNEVGGYRARSTPVLPHGGHRAAVLYRDLQPGYGRNYGELRQRVSAVPYRGQVVRIRAHVRALTGPGARVHLFARAGAAYDGMHDRPITTSGWTAYELVLPIAARATTLQLGLVVVGDGAAWLDDVTITPE